MDLTTWLIDKSAFVRLVQSDQVVEWAERIQRGWVRISTLTRLEVRYSARSSEELSVSMRSAPLASMPTEYLTPMIEDRAVTVQLLLAERGKHRAPSVPHLLIAATAESAQLTILHFDEDFELIADLTGQPIERLSG